MSPGERDHERRAPGKGKEGAPGVATLPPKVKLLCPPAGAGAGVGAGTGAAVAPNVKPPFIGREGGRNGERE